MTFKILPYRTGSKSAKLLAEALGGKVLRRDGPKFSHKPSQNIINWGCSYLPERFSFKPEQAPEDISEVSCKLSFFKLLEAIPITPDFWTSKDDIPDDRFPIVCRTVLNGHSGNGIVISNNREELVGAPLYVEYKKKKEEYRVHIGHTPSGDASILSVQRKARKLECEEPNWQIRNHANGFVYVREGFETPSDVEDVAIRAMSLTSLQFGAVDIIWNEHEKRAYVLEINTAPGLEGQTVEDYKNYFLDFYS